MVKRDDKYKNASMERIIELIEEFCGTEADRKQQAFADMCGVSKFSISQYVNGSNAPGNITAAKIANKCKVDPLWVMGFDVPKRKKFTATFSTSALHDAVDKLDVENSEQHTYYTDIETAELAYDMSINPKLRALCEAQRGMDPADLDAMYNMAMALKRKSERLDMDDPC